MRCFFLGCLILLLLHSSVEASLFEENRSSQSSQSTSSQDRTEEESTNGESPPRTDFVRITRASGERHERQISRRLEAFGDGERHMITVDRNGNILQFRRPAPSFFPPLQSSPFRQSPFFQRVIPRPRSSHGFSRRRPPPPTPPPLVTRPPTTTVTHDGSMSDDQSLKPPTVTREGTVTNDFRRVPVRTRPSGRVHSMRLVHGGSMERGSRENERVPVSHPIGRGTRPLRISSSFEVIDTRDNDRFRIGGPPFGEISTTIPPPRVFIQTPRPLRPRPPPRQRPQQPPRRVEALSNDEQEFTPSGRSPVSPSVLSPFRSFRPRLPSTRFTLPPRSPLRLSSLHTSPFSSTSSSTTLTTTEPSTTTVTTTASTTSATESTTTLTTPSTTMQTTTPSTTLPTTVTTSRPMISSVTSTTRRTTLPIVSSRLPSRDPVPVSPFLHSSSFLRPQSSTLPPTTLEPLHLTPSSSPSPFLPSSTTHRDSPTPTTQDSASSSIESFEDDSSFVRLDHSFPTSTDTSSPPPSPTPSFSPSSPPSTLSLTPSTLPPSTPDPSSLFRDSPTPLFNQNVRILTTTRSSVSSPEFDLSDLPDEFNFESSTQSDEGAPPTPRPKLISPHTDKTTLKSTTSTIGKTTTVPKMTTVTRPVTRVTPPPTAKTRKTGTTRGFATVSPSISVKALPPAIPDDLAFNGIRGPLPPSSHSHLPHSTTVVPPTGRVPSFPHSLSFDGPPGEMPPSDNIVQMLNEADDFLEMARRLNITRKARIARRRRRMAEYGRW